MSTSSTKKGGGYLYCVQTKCCKLQKIVYTYCTARSILIGLPSHTYMFTKPYLYVYQAIHICLPSHTYMFTKPYLYVYQAILICLPSHTYMFTKPYLYVYQAIRIGLPSHTYRFTKPYLYVYQGILICLPRQNDKSSMIYLRMTIPGKHPYHGCLRNCTCSNNINIHVKFE